MGLGTAGLVAASAIELPWQLPLGPVPTSWGSVCSSSRAVVDGLGDFEQAVFFPERLLLSFTALAI